MKKIVPLIYFFLAAGSSLRAQYSPAKDSSLIITINQQVDNDVVQQNMPALNKVYAEDLVFTHGSGHIDGKQSWLNSVAKGNFLSRQHDSVTVEMHPGLAIVRGKLSVQKKSGKDSRYHLKYVRVFALRDKQWQMIPHVTVWEIHEPG